MGRVDLSERLLARALVMPERAVGRGGAVVHRVRRSRGARNVAFCLAVAWLVTRLMLQHVASRLLHESQQQPETARRSAVFADLHTRAVNPPTIFGVDEGPGCLPYRGDKW